MVPRKVFCHLPSDKSGMTEHTEGLCGGGAGWGGGWGGRSLGWPLKAKPMDNAGL